ncbi:MAG: ester cyclase [Chitinophagaceae bacterium]
MKKLFFASAVGACCFFISCNNKTENHGDSKMSDKATKNVDMHHAVTKAIETGDVSKLGDYIATDAVDHANPKGDVKGLENIKAELGKVHTMASDMKTEVLKTMADDDHVFEWVRYTGTTKTTDMGMPVGTKYDMTAMHIVKFKDGKATEHWEYMQPAEMMKMMGQAPAMDNKMDTLKK